MLKCLSVCLAAALLANATAESYKNDRCKKNGLISFLFDGISHKHTKHVIKTLKGHLPVSFFLSSEELSSNEAVKIAKHALNEGNSLGYRPHPNHDERFHKYSPKKLEEELKKAKSKFKHLFHEELKYVMFPWSESNCKKLYKVAHDQNLTVVGHNLYLDPHDGKTTKKIVQQHIKHPNKNSFITYQNSHLPNQGATALRVKKYAERKRFNPVKLHRCLAKHSSHRSRKHSSHRSRKHSSRRSRKHHSKRSSGSSSSTSHYRNARRSHKHGDKIVSDSDISESQSYVSEKDKNADRNVRHRKEGVKDETAEADKKTDEADKKTDAEPQKAPAVTAPTKENAAVHVSASAIIALGVSVVVALVL